MGLFNKNAEQVKAVKSPETVYAAARSNLLLVVAFTAVNIILRLVSADMYFLFSASTPMAFLDIIALTGAAELLPIAAAWAFIVTGFYLLCWFLSKKRSGWMIVAAVLFALDTVVLLLLYNLSAMIIDLAMHAWVLYYLISGSVAAVRMKKMPAEMLCPEIALEQPVYDPAAVPPMEGVSTEFTAPAAPVMVNGQPLNDSSEE